MNEITLGPDVLNIDLQAEVEKIGSRLREILKKDLNRRGLVVAMSGGIDSSVCAALAVHALGKNKVFGLLMPEKDSSSDSLSRAELLAQHLELGFEVQDIAPTLEAIGYICQDIQDYRCLEAKSDQILTAIVHGMKRDEPSAHVRLAATNALFNSLEFTRTNFEK